MAFTFPDPPSNLRFKETTTITTSPMTPRVLRSEAWALTEAQPERRQSLSLIQVVFELERSRRWLRSDLYPHGSRKVLRNGEI